MTLPLDYHPDVQHALQAHKPLVALESTLITHGLPYPANRDTALAMEQAVRDNGAIPATIAILDGRITVGLSPQQIDMLAQADHVRKCSRRDIPIAVGLREHGATTVAATMLIAHIARIPIFATGGIGGVHRDSNFDVSADLHELGRTPVTVVCAGAKSILDLRATLEVLETQGVPVLGMQTDTLPAFYVRDSDLPVTARVDSIEEAARITRALHDLAAQHGMLITVPVPEAYALSADIAEQAIQQATDDAHEQQITGAAITPFLLNRIAELTEGQSIAANKALLINNATIAAQIAAALQSI